MSDLSADGIDLTVRASVGRNEGQKWGALCLECKEGEITQRPEGSPGLPESLNKFLIRHSKHDTESGTVQTNDAVRPLYEDRKQ